ASLGWLRVARSRVETRPVRLCRQHQLMLVRQNAFLGNLQTLRLETVAYQHRGLPLARPLVVVQDDEKFPGEMIWDELEAGQARPARRSIRSVNHNEVEGAERLRQRRQVVGGGFDATNSLFGQGRENDIGLNAGGDRLVPE